MLFKKVSPWQVSAVRCLWRRDLDTRLPLLETPHVGNIYHIELEDENLKEGDCVDVEYLPATAYYNALETIEDLFGMRIFSGTMKAISGCDRHEEIEAKVEGKFHTFSCYSLSYFLGLPSTVDDRLGLWRNFVENEYFYNIYFIDAFIFLSWSSDSYVGAKCIIERSKDDFYVIYANEWADGGIDQINCGRVKVPANLAKKLRRRLSKMGSETQWHGHEI